MIVPAAVNAGLVELLRVSRPGGRLLLAARHRWLPGRPSTLARAVDRAGYEHVRPWTREPPSRGAGTAALLTARRPTSA